MANNDERCDNANGGRKAERESENLHLQRILTDSSAARISVDGSDEERADFRSRGPDILYGVTDNPPWPLAILLGFQV